MITLAFKLLVQLLLSPIVALDDVSFSTSTLQAFTSASGYFSSFRSFLPLCTVGLLTFFLAIVSVEFFVGIYKSIMWIIRRVPGQG